MSFVEERGPEAVATRARLLEGRVVHRGEGTMAIAGIDGPSFCVCTGEGTLIGFLDESEVSEADWRAAQRVYRFATAAERDAFVARRGWMPSPAGDVTGEYARSLAGRFRLNLFTRLSSSFATVEAEAEEGRVRARLTRSSRGRRQSFELEPPVGEWARFLCEMRLLDAHRWDRYVPQALDGLEWEMVYETLGLPVEAGGANAYPPAGDGPTPTPAFTRMLLAVERLIGREVWGRSYVSDALGTIPDDRDRVEHLLLAALRAWGADIEASGADPEALKEADLERGLAERIATLTSCRTQLSVNARMADWPRVGALDIELSDVPAWVELKWAKTASVLHNCLWDAAKVAQGRRGKHARYGYLVAGAPAGQWRSEKGPTGLFDVSVWRGDTLVTEHQSWWSGWYDENVNTYPLRLPTPVITVPVGHVRCAGPAGEEWVVKVARVEAPGTDSYVPPPRR